MIRFALGAVAWMAPARQYWTMMQLRYLPNAISLARLSCVPILVWLAFIQDQQSFKWLLLAAGLTDALDGWIARHFGWTSALGALLDSIADVLLIVVAIYGIWRLHPQVFIGEWKVFAAVIGIWTLVHVVAVIRYGRLASFHTRLTQVGIILFGLFVILLLFYAFVPWFFYLAAAICFLGGVESLVMIPLIPDWTPDLRGGLVAILSGRGRAGS